MLEHLDRLVAAARALGVPVTSPVAERLSLHWDLVREAGERMNLTRVAPEDAWVDHVLDSLALLSDPRFPDSGQLVDVGSGAGYPGLALAIARPGLRVTLLESNGRRAQFLAGAVAQLGLATQCRVVQARAEEVARGRGREAFPVLVARALAPLPVLLELTLPMVAVGGVALLCGGPRMAAALPRCTSAARRLGGEPVWVPVALPDRHRGWVRVEKRRHTPGVFPRNYGVMRRQPLAPTTCDE